MMSVTPTVASVLQELIDKRVALDVAQQRSPLAGASGVEDGRRQKAVHRHVDQHRGIGWRLILHIRGDNVGVRCRTSGQGSPV